ncbi:MAG: flagellar hook-associated protein FlgK [Proteobacteria bacterium]|nr:flagellar hook-associated protein FlgK [Pseudomonadota bacterium]
MTSLLNALNAGKTSLLTNQKSIEIVGNNIANVNTPGYSRQRAQLTNMPSVNFGGFFIGQGVTVSDVSRDYSLFITRQLQGKTIDYGEASGKSNALTELERTFNVSQNNLSAQINDFFDAWQQLTTNPSGQVERDLVIQRGQLLGEAFNSITNEMDSITQNIDREIVAEVPALNVKLAELARLNERINLIEVTGQTANSDRDSRDLLVQDLSETLGIQTYTDNRGMLCAYLPGGTPLVMGTTAATISTVTEGTTINLQVNIAGSTRSVGVDDLGGKFKGMFEMRDVFIQGLRDDLNTLAIDLTTTVNDAHLDGYGSDGVTGRLFFNDISALPPDMVASRSIVVALTDTSQVAVAGNPAAAPGDNENALRIAQLESTHKVGTTNNTFNDFFSQMVATVGVEAAHNNLAMAGAQDATMQLQNLRDGYSGVSLEEEMVDLIQYQRGFQSSAKYLATVDELMNSLLQLKN